MTTKVDMGVQTRLEIGNFMINSKDGNARAPTPSKKRYQNTRLGLGKRSKILLKCASRIWTLVNLVPPTRVVEIYIQRYYLFIARQSLSYAPILPPVHGETLRSARRPHHPMHFGETTICVASGRLRMPCDDHIQYCRRQKPCDR